MRAYTHRLTAFVIQSLVILLLAFGLSFSVGQSLAQDATTDAPAAADTTTVVPTDLPTDVPTIAPTDVPTAAQTDVPTDVPTEVPSAAPTAETTSAPTEAVTEQPTAGPTDATATEAPTQNATEAPATQASPDLFTQDFQDGQSSAWLLTAGWAIADEAGNKLLTANTPNEMATLTGVAWPYYTLSVRVRGDIQFNLTAGGSSYQIRISADGAASLFKDGALIGQAAGTPAAEATVEPAANWHTVNLLAPGNLLAVKVDNFTPISTTDASLVGMGPLMVGTSADNAGSVSFDDLSMQRLDAPPPIPTVVPTDGGVVPIPTAVTVTEVPTVEVTPEATSEATAEATVEATSEATAEATSEATAEATLEPLGLSDAARKKLPPELIDILQSYEAGDTAGAKAAAADYFIATDQQQRISVTVWTTDEQAAAKIAAEINANNGLVTDVLSVRLQALVTLEGLIALANSPEVNLIEVPPRAVSTSNLQAPAPTGYGIGTEISEGVDTTGAAAWQNAGIKGANVNIAVIDTGFGSSATVAATGEYACLGNSTILNQAVAAGDTTHGLLMVQVLCDMAPAAKVFMYKATTATNLQNAVTNAATSNKIIVIAMDLGASVSPGDGTGGGALFANGLYSAITNARNAGKIVIASAGNNTGRYATLDYGGSGTISNINLTVFPGDTIHVSWNDWAGTLNGALVDDFSASISGLLLPVSFGNTRTAASLPPRYSRTIATSECSDNVNGCTGTLTFNHTAGENAAIVLQVQVNGKGTLDTGTMTGATENTNAGNLARPADSQDVIAVGAVCPDSGFSLFLDSSSSHGPVFAAGGGAPTAAAPFTRDQVKPDLVGPTHVSIAGNRTTNQAGCDPNTGFNGTSAAAAHIAGMAALLVSNTNSSMAAFDGTTSAAVDAVQNYLQTHTIDNTSIPGFGVGYDMSYGAGYTVLGSPTYDLTQITTISTPANQLPASCPTALYVGLNNPGSLQSGTLANPYIDINEALANATTSQCVVLLPGEYVSPIVASSGTNAPAILSYKSAVSFIANPSNLWSTISSPVFISSNDIMVDGFNAQSAFMLTYIDGTSIRTEGFRIRTSTGTIIQNSVFTNFRSPGVIVDSSNIQIKSSSFTGFVIPLKVAAGFNSPASRSAVIDIKNTPGVVVSNNVFQSNSIPNIASSGIDITPYQPAIIGIIYGGLDVFNNKFEQNTSATIIGVNQRQDPNNSISSLQTAEIRVFGNVINSNTIKGPLLHLEAAPNLRFVNNSVLNNVMSGAVSEYSGYFMYGRDDSAGTYFNGHNLEIHNNLFYNNGTPIHGLVRAANSAVIPYACLSIEGGAPKPVRNNWFDTTLPADDCTGNTSGTVTDPITPATFFGTDADPVDPYRLRPNTTPSTKGGINTGDNTAVTDIFGPDLTNVFDLTGSARKILGRNDTPPWDSTDAVDIGAYELGIASPPVANNITQTITEDSASSVVFKLTATGGYSRFFAITAPPTNYDTTKTNACGGQPVAFSPPNTVTYCPPPNFHTFYGASGANVPVVIGFSVEDKVGNPGLPDNKTITLTINPQDDGVPTPQPINAITDYGSPLTFQLGPAPTFNNFNLIGSANGLDYPVTFAYGAYVPTAGDNPKLLAADGTQAGSDAALSAAFTQANSNGGKLIVNPIGGQIGRYSFTYTITEVNGGQSASGTGTITVVPAIAQDGHYDDDSFYVAYTGAGWTPSYSVATAYNHTLHSTKTATNQLEFPFTGKVVSLNMLGTSLPNSTTKLKVEFNLDISAAVPTYLTYAQAKVAIPSLSCVNTLNNAAPDASSNILNYSASSAAYKLICRGFPVGAVQSIRLTNNLANAAMTLDSMDVGSGIFKPGFYQESDINVTYNGTGWIKQANASASGGTRTYATGAANSYTFQIKNAARFVLYTSPGPTGGTMQVCITPAGGSATCSNRSDFHAGTTLYQQQQAFSGLDSTLVYTIDVTNVAPSTGYIDLDAIRVFAPTSALTPGLYQQDNANITYNGSGWITQAAAAASGGSRTYSTGATNNYSFQVTGASRFTLYTSTSTTGGTMQVCITPIPAGFTQTCNNRSDNSSVALWQQKLVFGGLDTTSLYTVTVSNVSTVATQYIDLDAIEVFGSTAALGPGLYQQENVNISYIGNGWKLASAAAYSGGSNRYSYTVGDSYKFKIMNAGRFTLYTSPAPTGGTMQVCIAPLPPGANSGCSTRTNLNTPAVYQQQQVFTGLDTGTVYTITVTNVSSPATPAKFIDLDAVEVLPDVVPLQPSQTLYQQNNTNIIYNGFGWTTVANASASGGNYRSSTVLNNSYTFQIANTDRFVLYVTPGTTGSTISVSCIKLVAGVPTGGSVCTPATASLYSATPLYQQPRYFTGLSSAEVYKVTVTNTVAGKATTLDAIEVNAPLAPLSLGLHQQNDVAIRYTGAGWKTVSNVNASGGNYKNTFAIGNSYAFQVGGAGVTRFALYTSPSATGGTMSVCLTDITGGLPGTPILPCTTFQEVTSVPFWQQQKMVTLPVAGNTYSVLVTNTSSATTKYIDLDAIEVSGVVGPLTPGFYQQDNANITYSAGWTTVANASASGGNYKSTTGVNSNSYSFDVTGADRFVLFTSAGPTGGTMKVCISPVPTGPGGVDCNNPVNNPAAIINQYSATALYQQPHYFTGLLSGTTYTVTVTNTTAVAGKYVDLDAVQVDAPLQPLVPTLPLATPGFYQQNDVNIRYTGAGWKTVANASASVGSYKSTFGINNKFEFLIQGADRFVLYMTPGLTGDTFDAFCNDQATPNITIPCTPATGTDYAATTQFQQPRFFTVPDSSHTYLVIIIKKTAVTTKYIDIDAIEVLAPIQVLTPPGGIGSKLFQENDPNIIYTGTGWTRATSTLYSGSNQRSTAGIGNSYQFKVSGVDRFSLLVSKGPTAGTMQVCIVPTPTGGTPCIAQPDPVNNINLYAATTLYQQPYYFTGLNSGTPYTVTVTNVVAGKSISLDAIQVDAPIASLSLGLHQENDVNIRYTGLGWKAVANANASLASYRSTTTIGSSYTFQFTGADRFVLYTSPSTTGGTMQVCITDVTAATPATCSNRVENATAQLWQQPQFFGGLTPGDVYSVTVKNVSAPPVPPAAAKYIDLDAIEILAPAAALTPSAALYQETDPKITYTGTGWSRTVAAAASGGTFRSTKLGTDTITFTISGATRFALLTSPSTTGGTMKVCITELPSTPLPCVNRSDNAPAARYQQAQIFTGLNNTKSYSVTISKVSTVATQYIDLDAIQVVDTPAVLQPGWYQDTDLNLTYTGTWTQDAQTGVSAGQTTFTTVGLTTSPTNEMRFTFQGTGFSIFTFNATTGASMEICYRLSSDPDDSTFLCATTPTTANPAQNNVGYAVYGLKQGTYIVRVRRSGASGTQGLYIDKVAVLGTPATTLTAGTYENSNAALVYSPASLWAVQANVNFSGGNISASVNKGATLQIKFVGTTLILYQTVGPTYSRNVLLCRVISGPVTNPPPQCGSFSQNTAAVAYKVPIAFYGFGSGTNEVVIENRNQGSTLNIDKIMVN